MLLHLAVTLNSVHNLFMQSSQILLTQLSVQYMYFNYFPQQTAV